MCTTLVLKKKSTNQHWFHIKMICLSQHALEHIIFHMYHILQFILLMQFLLLSESPFNGHHKYVLDKNSEHELSCEI